MKIYYIMGKSGSGKDYIKKRLLNFFGTNSFRQLPEYTTRTRRDSDISINEPCIPTMFIASGVDEGMISNQHIFVPEELFISLKNDGFFAETRSYEMIDRETGNPKQVFYGTPNVIKAIENRDFKFLPDLYVGSGTPESFKWMQSVYTEKQLIPLYIDVPDNTRLIRALLRESRNSNPKYDEVCRRFLSEKEEPFYTMEFMGIDSRNVFSNKGKNDWTKIAYFITLDLVQSREITAQEALVARQILSMFD